jgi:hypothetical protein
MDVTRLNRFQFMTILLRGLHRKLLRWAGRMSFIWDLPTLDISWISLNILGNVGICLLGVFGLLVHVRYLTYLSRDMHLNIYLDIYYIYSCHINVKRYLLRYQRRYSAGNQVQKHAKKRKEMFKLPKISKGMMYV